MITKESGLRYAKLVHVSVDNGLTAQSNKLYIMEEQSDGNIKCEYGRVGKNLVTVFKKSHEWNKVYKSKVNPRKGYTDVTDMMITEEVTDTSSGSKKDVKEIENMNVRSLFNDLMAFANKSIQKNYKVTQEAVTQLQVDSAQDILTKATKLVKKGKNMDIKQVNDLLIELYTIIPRNMSDVRDYLGQVPKKNETLNVDWIKNLVSNEQDTLDTMAGQVKLIKQQQDTDGETDEIGEDADITILEQMGLKAEVETDPDKLALVHKLLGNNSKKAKKIIKVINNKTQAAFDKNLKSAKVKKKRLYWHGSRNENWFNIIQTGLMIRPSGAIHTDSMFGDGIYFANKSQKSLGYSSLSGSYWSGGNANKGYLALFDVHVGKQKDITNHNSSCYSLSKKVMIDEGYDSVYAHGGADLRNDEFIVYDASQCTISYMIEMQNTRD